MFDNVNYTFYSSTLGRGILPDEATFNAYKLENIAYMRTLLPFVTERQENGIDSAVCMMIEESYKADKNKTADGRIETSRNIEGFSQNFDVSNVQTLLDRKHYWIKLFCFIPAVL